MRSRNRFALLLALACCVVYSGATQATADVARSRAQYSDAVDALGKGDKREFHRLRDNLEDYPLAIYLDYFELRKRPSSVSPGEARDFVQASEGSPLTNRFLSVYLERAGREGRWQDFLALMPEEPNSVELQCYFYRAQLEQGELEMAWQGAEKLWVYGQSRPKACDPLFDAWMKAGQLNDAIVWARLLKTFEARQRSLMRYVARQGSADLAPWSDRLQQVYASPERMDRVSLPADAFYSQDIASHGVAYLARYNPEKALAHWLRYQSQMAFSADQQEMAESAIVLHSLFTQSAANRTWVDNALVRLRQDRLVEIRLRWALGEQDWQAMEQLLTVLSGETRQESVWRYWAAHIAELRGDVDSARADLARLAAERDYYGFLAADRIGRPYAFNPSQPAVLAPQQRESLLQLPGVRRVGELNWHDEPNSAHSEWYQLMSQSESARLQELASLAAGEGWFRMAIDAANRAKAWDALDLRFPMPYRDTFSRYASQRKVPTTELMAIARRESAFYPQARSPVGARGLMQIMPATGKQVAASLGARHSTTALYDVEHNVLLGSAYYRQLLDRFDGNRVFALTAYNAGPHRVDRWRHKPADTVPVEVWIETIPYKETRNYVQAVLAYNVVFSHLGGDTATVLLTPGERAMDY